jgi:hypothetical protein
VTTGWTLVGNPNAATGRYTVSRPITVMAANE